MTTDMAQFFGGSVKATTGTSNQTDENRHGDFIRINGNIHNHYVTQPYLTQNTTTDLLTINDSGYLLSFGMTNISGVSISDVEGHIVVDGTEVLDINVNGVADDNGFLFYPPFLRDSYNDHMLVCGGQGIRFNSQLKMRVRHDSNTTRRFGFYFFYLTD